MKISVISAAIASVKQFFFSRDEGQSRMMVSIIECIMLIVILGYCYWVYNVWTKPIECYYFVKLEKLHGATPKSISITGHFLQPLQKDSISNYEYKQEHVDEIGVEWNDTEERTPLDTVNLLYFERQVIDTVSIDSLRSISRLTVYSSTKYNVTDNVDYKDGGDLGKIIHRQSKDSLINVIDHCTYGRNIRKNDVGIMAQNLLLTTAYGYIPITIQTDAPLAGSFFESGDISHFTIHFMHLLPFETNISNYELNFGQPAVIQSLSPEPDYQDAFRVVYTDSTKLAKIKNSNQFSCIIEASASKQLQEYRMNALMMIMTLAFSLLVGLAYKIYKQILSRSKHRKLKFLYVYTLFNPLIIECIQIILLGKYYRLLNLCGVTNCILIIIMWLLYGSYKHKMFRKLVRKIIVAPFFINLIMVFLTYFIISTLVFGRY